MDSWSQQGRREFLQWTALSLAGLAGCRPEGEEERVGEREPTELRRPVALRLVVVDDPALAASVQQQWQLRGEGSLEVEQRTIEELLASDRAPEADAILYPSGLLGTLAERRWLLPVPDEVLRDPNLDWRDVFELVRLREVLWDRTTYALAFGSPPLMLLYRGDLWQQYNLPVPETWADYKMALEAARGIESVPGLSAEPLAPGWAAHVLLARAAAYALHRGYLAAWFELDSMEPQIASPPFERALDELAAACPDPAALEWTPQDTFACLARGEALAALSWPARHVQLPAEAAGLVDQIQVAELPGASEAFQRERQEWSARDAGNEGLRVTLLGAAGRLGSVLKRSTHRSAAANLLVWLSGPEWSSTVASASSATTISRRSQLAQVDQWIPERFSERSAEAFAEALSSALSRPGAVLAPRLPGRSAYLAALDEAVAAVLRDRIPTAAALTAAATRWQAITDQYGRDAQREAYRRSLGI